MAVDFRGSLPWPWYAGQRLGVLPPAGPAQLISGLRARRGARPLAADARRRGPARGPAAARARGVHQPLPAAQRLARGGARRGRPPAPASGTVSRARDAAFYALVTGFANRCDLVTAPTATALRLLRDHGLRVPSQAVSNGVDLGRFSPGPPDEALRSRYGLPAGPAARLVGRQAQPGKARGRADRGGSPGFPGGRTGPDAGPVLVLAGTGPTRAGCAPSPATTASADRVAVPRVRRRRRPARPVPAGRRVRHRVAGRAAVPGHHGGDGQRAAGRRGRRGRPGGAGARRRERLPGPAGERRGDRRLPRACSAATRACGRGCRGPPRGSSAGTTGIACSPGGNPSTARSPHRAPARERRAGQQKNKRR